MKRVTLAFPILTLILILSLFGCGGAESIPPCIPSQAKDTSGQTRLTEKFGYDNWPSWSPDGCQVVFTSNRDNEDFQDIWIMNADGSDQARLIENKSNEYQPYWSPDGTQIAFVSHGDKSFDVWRIDADGSNKVNITKTETQEGSPSWGR